MPAKKPLHFLSTGNWNENGNWMVGKEEVGLELAAGKVVKITAATVGLN